MSAVEVCVLFCMFCGHVSLAYGGGNPERFVTKLKRKDSESKKVLLK